MNPREAPEAVEPLLDLRQASELVGYFTSSLKRHRGQIVLMALLTTALTIPALVYLPRTYTTTARVTARREVTRTVSPRQRGDARRHCHLS